MDHLFKRVGDGPILSTDHLDFSASAVYNPGAIEHDGDVILLLRVEDRSGQSNIHVARSRNGISDWDISGQPILSYDQPDLRYEQWGCEDPRITYFPDEQCYYITYTAASGMGPAVGLARTNDFQTVERIGLVFAPTNKDAVMFPKKFDDRYAILHRPEYGELENIWSAYSPDLTHWGEPHCVLEENLGPAWDAYKVGSGPPPIETEYGWLLIYHGVKYYAGMMIYRAGLALLEKDRPHKLKARHREWVFQAKASFELEGFVPGVIFPTGLIQRDDELWMYYGAADTYVGLAIARYDDMIQVVQQMCEE